MLIREVAGSSLLCLARRTFFFIRVPKNKFHYRGSRILRGVRSASQRVWSRVVGQDIWLGPEKAWAKFLSGSRSRKQKQKNHPITKPCLFFGFHLRLRQSSFHWIISIGVNRNRKKIGDCSDTAYDSDFRFSLGRKRFDSDSDSDSVASENQPFGILFEVDRKVLVFLVLIGNFFYTTKFTRAEPVFWVRVPFLSEPYQKFYAV